MNNNNELTTQELKDYAELTTKELIRKAKLYDDVIVYITHRIEWMKKYNSLNRYDIDDEEDKKSLETIKTKNEGAIQEFGWLLDFIYKYNPDTLIQANILLKCELNTNKTN